MGQFYDEDDYDDDDFDAGLGGLGEVINYYTPPIVPRAAAPTASYNTVSDDERATSGSEQPKKEFSIWDSVAKPSKKTRTPTHSARPSSVTSTKKRSHTPPTHASSSSYSNSNFNLPGAEPSPVDAQSAHQPEPSHSTDSNSLLLFGGIALIVVVVLSSGRK
jgi:cobalamin biosynthesis Mg chelatase CobN